MTISIANQLDGGLSPCEPELSSTPGGSLKGTQELSASSDEMTDTMVLIASGSCPTYEDRETSGQRKASR